MIGNKHNYRSNYRASLYFEDFTGCLLLHHSLAYYHKDSFFLQSPRILRYQCAPTSNLQLLLSIPYISPNSIVQYRIVYIPAVSVTIYLFPFSVGVAGFYLLFKKGLKEI